MNVITGKPTKVEFYKEYTTSNGNKLYQFNVYLEGDEKRYSYSSKSQNDPKIKVGVSNKFEIEEKSSSNGSWWIIKPHKENNYSGGYSRKIPEGSFACSYAKKIAVALIEMADNSSMVDDEFHKSTPYIQPFKDWIVENTSEKSAYLSYAVDVAIAKFKAGTLLLSPEDIIKVANYYAKFD